MTRDAILRRVERYYGDRLARYGPTASGVDWNSEASQQLRFAQLLRVCDREGPFAINDYGCGYGALALYLRRRGRSFAYRGFDISEGMRAEARAMLVNLPDCEVVDRDEDLAPADYTVASGIFNVKLDVDPETWTAYVLATLDRLDALSTRGFSFNLLTSHADPDRMRPDLYYGDPGFFFDHCARRYSRHVALLHDYGLFEFTILVRREPA